MKRVRRLLLAILILALVMVALWFTAFQTVPVPVTVHRVTAGRVELLVVNSRAGTVKSHTRAQLSTGVSGTVIELLVKKGDAVAAGRLLLRLDDRELKAQVDGARRTRDAAQAAVREAAVQWRLAESERARNATLAAQGAIAAMTLEQFTARRDAAAAMLDAARERVHQADASLSAQEAMLAKTTLYAPFDGTVADITTERGEWLSPSPPGVMIPPVIDLFDPDSLYVAAPLDEVDLGKVRVGLPVRITIDAYADSPVYGRITRISPYVADIQEQNRTFEVEVAFDDPVSARRYRPGSTADIEVILEARANVLRIPTYALLDGDKVLVVREDRLVSVTVTTGLKNWEFTEILSGLAAGDRVVVSLDRAEVKEGAKVVATDESKP